MKVVICSPLMSYPGHFLRITKEKAECLRRAGMEVTVVAFRESFREEFSREKIPYVSVAAAVSGRLEKIKSFAARLGIAGIVIIENFWTNLLARQYARQQKADLVFVTDLEPWVILLLALIRRLQPQPPLAAFLPYPYFEKSTAFRLPFFSFCRALLNHALTGWLPRRIDIICDNQFNAQKIFHRPLPRVHIVPEGYAFSGTSKAEKQAAREKLGLPQNEKILLFFGVANQNKGPQLLSAALAGLDPEFVLLAVGTICAMFQPGDSAKTAGLKHWGDKIVRVPRFISEAERRMYFMACDAVILPYRRGFHTGSGSLRDAANYGKAIIASDQYQVGHLVKTYRLGLTFPPEDIGRLRLALREFACKPEPWFIEVEGNCRRLAAEYSWENVSGIYRRTFEKIIMDSGAGKDKV